MLNHPSSWLIYPIYIRYAIWSNFFLCEEQNDCFCASSVSKNGCGHAWKCAPIFHGSPPKNGGQFSTGIDDGLAHTYITQVEGGSQVKATCSKNRVAHFLNSYFNIELESEFNMLGETLVSKKTNEKFEEFLPLRLNQKDKGTSSN